MTELIKAVNLGKVVSNQLNEAGIHSLEELRDLGAENAFIRLREIDPGACICCLMALEGAVQNVRWHHLSDAKKQELKAFIQMIK